MKETMGIWIATFVLVAGSFLAAFYLGSSAASKPEFADLKFVGNPQVEIESAAEVEMINAGHFDADHSMSWQRGSASETLSNNF